MTQLLQEFLLVNLKDNNIRMENINCNSTNYEINIREGIY
jgi:hypothetical protein